MSDSAPLEAVVSSFFFLVRLLIFNQCFRSSAHSFHSQNGFQMCLHKSVSSSKTVSHGSEALISDSMASTEEEVTFLARLVVAMSTDVAEVQRALQGTAQRAHVSSMEAADATASIMTRTGLGSEECGTSS